MENRKRIAVVLCGSGYKDGSEIRESVAVLWALSEAEAEVQAFAPDAPQFDVVNCLTGNAMPEEKRNMLIESARIARGNVKPLTELKSAEFDAIVLPGGFGAAKNLCTFAQEGPRGKVRPELLSALREFRTAGKPIGAVCISPMVLALAFPGEKFTLTLGNAGEASAALESLGHLHRVARADEAVVDAPHRIVTSPAYMHDSAPLHEIFSGIRKCVREVLAMTKG